MKKGLSILLGLMTIVLIAGCGSKNEDTNNENA
jgi:predicted small lipoprotein YifL